MGDSEGGEGELVSDELGTRTNDWVQLFSGRKFWPLDPHVDEVTIADIAHGAAMDCRFGGHSKFFYSVAQHSVLVSKLVEARGYTPRVCLAALLHDGSEALGLRDLTRPVKYDPRLKAYLVAERVLQATIHQRFGLDPDADQNLAVKTADEDMLATEVRDVMGPPPEPWNLCGTPQSEVIIPWAWQVAEQLFLDRFAVIQIAIWTNSEGESSRG